MKKLIVFFLLCGCGLTDNKPEILPRYPDYLKTADAFNQFDERENRSDLKVFLRVDPVKYEWCAAFVNAVLRVNSIPGSESVSNNPLLARGFLNWGVSVKDDPQLGDIIIFPRGNQGWQGHVGFFIMEDEIDGVLYYLVLGGNQDNKVSYEAYRASSTLDIRRMAE